MVTLAGRKATAKHGCRPASEKGPQLAHIHASFGPVTYDLRRVPGALGSRLLGDRRGILTCTVFPNTGCTSGTLARLEVEGACRHFLWIV